MLVYLTCGAYLEHCSIGCILLLFHLTRSVIGPENSRVEGGEENQRPEEIPPPPSQAKTRTNHRRNAHVNLGSGIGTRPKRWGVEWGVGSRGQFFRGQIPVPLKSEPYPTRGMELVEESPTPEL